MRLEAAYDRTASWAACGGGEDAKEDYALQIVRLAMGTHPECPFDEKSPFWSFNSCFRPKDNLDDPKLEARFAPLIKHFADLPGADRLMEARTVLNASGMTLGNKAWLDARDAVLSFARVEEARQKDIEQLQQINNDAVNGAASAADRAKIARTLEAWENFVRSQEPTTPSSCSAWHGRAHREVAATPLAGPSADGDHRLGRSDQIAAT